MARPVQVDRVMFSKQLMTWRRPTATRSLGPFGVWLVGSSVGAGLVYLLDPSQGRRRRTLIVDKFDHYRHTSARLFGKAWRDLYNRATGLEAEARRRLAPAPADDDTLVARARSKLGRYASHPHALTVQAAHGKVTLAGPILEDHAKALIHAIERIPGVTGVDDQLERHPSAENVPALQGGRQRGGAPAEILQHSWTPSLRVGAGVAGLGLVTFGLRHRLGAALALPMGGALLLRAVLDRPLAALLGQGRLEDGFELRKSLTIHVPVERVFALLTTFEQYPQFMAHVKNVERVADSHYRWTVRGKAGVDLQFESELLELVPEQHLTWGHVGDRRGEHLARVRFEPAGDATRLHIEAHYLPRLGALGLGLTRLLGAHPKRLLDADLAVLKTLLEQGKARIDGRQVTVGELGGLPAQTSEPGLLS